MENILRVTNAVVLDMSSQLKLTSYVLTYLESQNNLNKTIYKFIN